MKGISLIPVLLLFAAAAAVVAQEEIPVAPDAQPEQEVSIVPEKAAPPPIKIQELENLTITALRREFPRLSGAFASAHSCRLPEYGPMVSVTIQLPAYYFTRPVLQELDRRQRAAEQQARKVKTQLERASQLISLRSREANLLERLEWEQSSKRKSKDVILELQGELEDVRKSLSSLEPDKPGSLLIVQDSPLMLNDVDLNKMLSANYQQLIQRVSKTMKVSLAENAPRIAELHADERVTLNAYIRDNILGSQGRTILFILHHKDIQEYRDGLIDLESLRDRVLVHDQPLE